MLHDGEAGSPATGTVDEIVQVDALVTVAVSVTDPLLVVTVTGDATKLAIFTPVVDAPAERSRTFRSRLPPRRQTPRLPRQLPATSVCDP